MAHDVARATGEQFKAALGSLSTLVEALQESVGRMLATGPVLAGLFAGFAVMYVTGMLVG